MTSKTLLLICLVALLRPLWAAPVPDMTNESEEKAEGPAEDNPEMYEWDDEEMEDEPMYDETPLDDEGVDYDPIEMGRDEEYPDDVMYEDDEEYYK